MGKLYCESCGEVYKSRHFNIDPDELICPCGGRRTTFRSQRASRGKGKAISEASPEQRAKVKGALSIISGKGPCDPAHIWDRRVGGCDDALCVIPLLRQEHRAYEEKRLDILPALIAGGFYAELGHVIVTHEVSPTRLVERLTGEEYGPVRELKARVVELEAGIAA